MLRGDSGLSCLPRVEIDSFDGNPSNFQTFFAVFDELVDKVTDDGQMKLTRLSRARISGWLTDGVKFMCVSW